MSKTTVELIFQGIDQTGAATNSALNNVNKFKDGMGKMGGSAAALGGSMNNLASTFINFATDAVMQSIDQAAQFQSAVTGMRRVLEESDAPIEQVIASVEKLAQSYGMSSTETMLAATEFKKSGQEALDAVELVETAIRVSMAADVELSQAAEFIKATMAGFGLAASDIEDVFDLLNQVANTSNTNLQELADGFASISPVAQTMGVGINETAGALTSIIEVFGSGSESARGLKTIFLNMQSEIPRVTDAMKLLGVAQRDVNDELRPTWDILEDVAGAWHTLDDNMKGVVAEMIVGKDQMPKFAALMNNWGATARITADDFEYQGSMINEVALIMEDYGRRTAKAQEGVSEIFKQAGLIMIGEAGRIQDGLSSAFYAIAESIAQGGPITGVLEVVRDILASLANQITDFAKALPEALAGADFSKFEDGIGRLADAVGRLFSEWDLTTPEGIIRAIDGIGNAFEIVTNMTAGFIASFQKVFDFLGGADVSVIEWFDSIAYHFGQFLGFKDQLDKLTGGLNQLIIPLSAIGGALAVILGPKLLLAGAITGIGIAIAALNWDKLLTPLSWLRDRLFGVNEQADPFIDFIEEDLSKLDKSAGYLGELNTQLGITVSTLDDFYKGVASGRFVNVNGQWEVAADYVEGYRYTVEEAAQGLEEFFTSQGLAWDKSTGEFKSSADSIEESTRDIRISMDDLGDASDQWVETVVNGVPTFRQAGREISKAYDETTQSAEDAIRQSKEFIMQMEELASNERIALIEAKVTLDVAQIESDTRRVESAFESLNIGIQSTGETMTDLAGIFAGTDFESTLDKWFVMDLIKDEMEFREKQFSLQKDLIESEIRLNNTRAAMMARGEALIQIDGAGLAPHLEAFMWETLRAIQVRVNADGLDMLLGTT